jgi:hypothetical protein
VGGRWEEDGVSERVRERKRERERESKGACGRDS